jgi:CRISPR/Cas system CMR subunit Cmr4 (Cas7 group RAMP superfamily)
MTDFKEELSKHYNSLQNETEKTQLSHQVISFIDDMISLREKEALGLRMEIDDLKNNIKEIYNNSKIENENLLLREKKALYLESESLRSNIQSLINTLQSLNEQVKQKESGAQMANAILLVNDIRKDMIKLSLAKEEDIVEMIRLPHEIKTKNGKKEVKSKPVEEHKESLLDILEMPIDEENS